MMFLRVAFSVVAVVLMATTGAQRAVASELEFISSIRRFEAQPHAVAIDPDGRHLYSAQPVAAVVGIYQIDPVDGRPTFVAMIRDGEDGVEGLENVQEIIVSPDGRHVYAGSWETDALVCFARERGGGHLVYVETVWDGQGGADGLRTPTGLAMSSDGRFLYVSAFLDHSVAVYSRDIGSGKLTFAQLRHDGFNGVTGLRNAAGVSLSPDGSHLYASGFEDDAVVVFSRDASNGKLSYEATAWNGQDGILGLEGPRDIGISPDGASVYVTASSSVVQFARDPLGGLLTYVDVVQNGVGGVTDLGGANSVTVINAGAGVAVAGFYSDSLVLFERDQISGGLTFVESHVDQVGGVTGMWDPTSIASGPGDAHLYLGTYYGNGVPVFEYDGLSGTASFVESIQVVPEVKGLGGPSEAEVSGDGANLYVAAPLTDSIVVLARDLVTGHLTFVQRMKSGFNGVEGIRGASAVAVSPEDTHVYVAGEWQDSIGIFSRNPSGGTLVFVDWVQAGVDGVEGLDQVEGLAISPGGEHLYAASKVDDALTVFERDDETGGLTFLEVHRDGENGVDGLNGAWAATVSSDGEHVYVAGAYGDTIAVFDRDPATGTLGFVEVQRDGINGVVGLDWPYSITLSPDGLHLYAACYQGDAVVVFEREPASGQLIFVEAQIDGSGGVNDLGGALAVRVSPDGGRVFVSSAAQAVLSFFRDRNTGGLTYIGSARSGENGVIGLGFPRHLTLTPDGMNLYVAAKNDNAVTGFRRGQPVADGVPTDAEVEQGLNLYSVDVGSCAQRLSVRLAGLSENLELMTRFDQPPTAADFDCRSSEAGTADEECVHDAPAAGRWWIGIEKSDPSVGLATANLSTTVEGCDGQGLVSWWRADGSTGDSIGVNDGLAEGVLGYAPAVLDEAFVMVSNGDAVVVPADVSLDVGISDFSLSLWLNTDDRRPFRSLVDSRSNDPAGFQLFLQGGRFGAQVADGLGINTVIGGRDLADGRWHHLSVTVDRDAPQGLQIFVDRKLDTIADPSKETGSLSSFEDLTFARRTDATGGEGFYVGMLDEVRFSTRALPRREAVDVFGGLRSWWPGDGDTSDHGGVNHAVGTPSFTQGRWGQAFEFGLSPDDHLIVPHHASLELGAGDFSVAFWLKSADAVAEQVVVDSRAAGPIGFAVAVSEGGPRLCLADSVGDTEFTADNLVADGIFHFVVITVDRDDADGIVFWVDGEIVQTFDPTAVPGSIDGGEDFTIGRSTAAMGSNDPFFGVVDELELYDRVLTQAEIEWLFADSAGLFFLDGFESGGLDAWSFVQP